MNYNVTAKELRLLGLLEPGEWYDADQIMTKDGRLEWKSAPSVHQTGTSLARKGLLAKGGKVRVSYAITPAGESALARAEIKPGAGVMVCDEDGRALFAAKIADTPSPWYGWHRVVPDGPIDLPPKYKVVPRGTERIGLPA